MKSNNPTAILGYGSQGRAWALNLKDSGREVIVGIPSGDSSRKVAKKDGIRNVLTISKAVKEAQIVIFAYPDHLHGRTYRRHIKPDLNPAAALVFLHAFSIHFQTVIPPDDCDVILLAPLGPGVAVRESYLKGKSIGYFHCIHHNATGRAQTILNGFIRDLKIDRKAMIKTTFRDEAIGDLFGEQAILCGGLSQLIKAGYDTLIDWGLSSDKAYLEVAYQLDLIIDLVKKHGIEGMFERISVAARYGSFLTGPKIIDTSVKKKMKKVLVEIENGRFARKLESLTPEKTRKLRSDLKKLTSVSFEKSARKFRP
ncbi:MAG: ketol-acid reductoisomerase [Candidatus Zixiibacteriota bacterium]|nr:MAG: ketol-acid reductoisomerase [candidate division Zixibacteria bacterium]